MYYIMNKNKGIRVFVAVVLLLGIYGCSSTGAQEPQPLAETAAVPVHKVVALVSDQPEFTISLPGELLPYEEADLFPKVRGFVKKVYADRGSYVKKGQLLALLEAPELAEDYSASRAGGQTVYQKYVFSRQAYERLKKAALKSGAVAEIELERAYAQLLADSAALDRSRAQTAASRQMNDYLHIRAPFSGVITSRNVSEGALTGDNGNKPLFSLAATSRLRLTVAVPEKEKSALHQGTIARFSVADLPGQFFEAALSRSSNTVDGGLRSVVAEFDVPNEDQKLAAGQYARVQLHLQRKQPTLWAPAKSVVRSQSGSFVLVVDEATRMVNKVAVVTGIAQGDKLEVFGALAAGDKVLQEASEEVADGTIIRTEEE